MTKLWQKNNTKIDPSVERFETGDDLLIDQKLTPFDIVGSKAHAKMLLKMNILTDEEYSTVEKGLQEIMDLYQEGQFKLQFGDEDIHTKIENYLTEKYGEVGKKIHTARSRNDQVLTAIRLLTKDYLKNIEVEVESLLKDLEEFINQYGDIKMPGYTHMQKAMPSSVKLWIGNFQSSLKDDLLLLKTAAKLNNQSPLGSAAGYGLPITIDRELTAKLLNFDKVQENPIYCQNSRGKIESVVLASLISILQTINKLSSDILIFTTSEFSFFQVTDAITTGSSIMPQKRNVDLAELLRSKVHQVLGNYVQLVSLSSNLISGYNRDFQDTKKPLIESLEVALDSVKVTRVLIQNIIPQANVLEKAMTEELYATEKALKLVLKGQSFRDAYKEVGKEYLKGGGDK